MYLWTWFYFLYLYLFIVVVSICDNCPFPTRNIITIMRIVVHCNIVFRSVVVVAIHRIVIRFNHLLLKLLKIFLSLSNIQRCNRQYLKFLFIFYLPFPPDNQINSGNQNRAKEGGDDDHWHVWQHLNLNNYLCWPCKMFKTKNV